MGWLMKRNNAEIRNFIQNSLKKRPMTWHELALDIGSNKLSVRRHLLWLERVGVVKRYSVSYEDENKTLWDLVKS